LAYIVPVIFIETSTFTKLLLELLSDDEYRELQQFLADNPEAGEVIQGTSGLRKVRWGVKGKGKRGGVRAIYYHVTAAAQIRFLLIYPKSAKEDLTSAEKAVLKKIVERW
jgi:mRNA-degrading endonuclease RelE of RelBE toxin-antitoxin system